MSEENAKPDRKKKAKKPHNKKRIGIVVGVVVVVIAVAGVGFWNWHEQPSFCNAICHSPMDGYLETWEAEAGQPATDKWGDAVSDGASMMASVHRTKADAKCLTCHQAVISEQLSEAGHWLTGDFYDPLDERDQDELTEARGVDGDQFCLESGCHVTNDDSKSLSTDGTGRDITRDDFEKFTADKYEFNPHTPQHGDQKCTSCHKAHRASVMMCTECHQEAVVPQGWVSADEGKALAEAQHLTQEGLAGVS